MRTERILLQMQKMADDGNTDVKPDRATITTCLNAITSAARRDRSAPAHAEQIIKRMEASEDPLMRPDAVAYTSLIRCWIESRDKRAAERGEEIIDFLHRRYDEGGHDECKPDTLVYNVAMDALAKGNLPDGAERAESLLNRMQERYYAGDSHLKPTTQSFSTVIQAWARSDNPKAAMRAERLLQAMEDLQSSGYDGVSPNTIVYSTCIMAWRNSARSDAGKRADMLLNKMEEAEKMGNLSLKPNAIVYTNAMDAWISSGNSDALEKVEEILERMKERCAQGISDSAPTPITFNVVMKAIQNSAHPTKHKRAEQLLSQMKDTGVKPTIVTYNNFFSTCARTEGDSNIKADAFSSLLNALLEMKDKRLRPDLYTWPAIWSACRQLLDVKKEFARINRMFDLTIESGLVNEYLFNSLRNILPPHYLQKKLNTTKPIDQLTAHDLPAEWTCNVTLKRDRMRRDN